MPTSPQARELAESRTMTSTRESPEAMYVETTFPASSCSMISRCSDLDMLLCCVLVVVVG